MSVLEVEERQMEDPHLARVILTKRDAEEDVVNCIVFMLGRAWTAKWVVIIFLVPGISYPVGSH